MKIKYMIVGFIAGVFAAISLSTGASTVYEKLTAIARPDYTLIVDGEKVTLNSPPKTIEGATHLPVRELATILGKDVTFKSGTIELKSKASDETMTQTDSFISLRSLSEDQNIKIKLGPTQHSQNTLSIIKDDVELLILDVVAPKEGDSAMYQVHNGELTELRFIQGLTHVKESLLIEAGIINQ